MEPNYSIELDLLKLRGANLATVAGRACVCIPYSETTGPVVVKGGACFLNLTAFALKDRPLGKSHFIKPRLPKAQLALMDHDAKKAIPYIGNMDAWGPAHEIYRADVSACHTCIWAGLHDDAHGVRSLCCEHPGAPQKPARDVHSIICPIIRNQ